MKVQKVIFSCDLNPQYVGYEPYAREIESVLQIVRDNVK